MGKIKNWIKEHKVAIAAVAAGTLGLVVGGAIVQSKYPSKCKWVGFSDKTEADFLLNIMEYDGKFLYDNVDGIAIKDLGKLGENLLEGIEGLSPDEIVTDIVGYKTTKRKVPTVL